MVNLLNIRGLIADYQINEVASKETADGIQMLIAALDDIPYLIPNTKITDIETLKVIAHIEKCKYHGTSYSVTEAQEQAVEELLDRTGERIWIKLIQDQH